MALIITLSIFAPMSTDMYLSGLPRMIADFATNESTMNMSLYCFMLALAVSILFFGPMGDKYGRKKVLSASLLIYIAACIACCFAPNIWAFVAFRIIEAIGSAGALTSAFALIKDLFEGPDVKIVLSVTAALGILGPILAPVIGTALINTISWHATFWLPAIIAGMCLVMTALLPDGIPFERYEGTIAGSVSMVFGLMKEKAFFYFMTMMCVFSASQLAYIAVSSYVYQGQFGLDSTQYSLALAGACILGLGVSLCVRKAKFLTNKGKIAVIFGLGVISLLMMTFVAKIGWLFFMLSMVPCCSNTVTARSFGYGLLMGHHDGDNGSVSSALNFMSFVFIFIGMAAASSFPSDMFIYAVAIVMVFSCTAYAVMWYLLKKGGYAIKGLNEE